MKAFFACGDGRTAKRILKGHNVLISFAYIGTSWLRNDEVRDISAASPSLMIDSGAFTAWRKGLSIDMSAYTDWLLTKAPKFETAIALDVIGDADASVANWNKMRAMLQGVRLMPVWHEGDPHEHLLEYTKHAEIVGIGRIEGRRSETKTLALYDDAFNHCPTSKFHALGNCNPKTLEPYPFESFDGITWQLDSMYASSHAWPWSRVSKDSRMRAYVEATETIVHRPIHQLAIGAE